MSEAPIAYRSGSHRLRCETGRWKVPKEEWEDKICRFFNEGVVETEWHYLKDCTTYEDIRNQHKETLKVHNIKDLFEGPSLLKGAILLVQIHNKRDSQEKSHQTD